jgi:hypothetical protein
MFSGTFNWMRASETDRNRVIEVVKTSFVEGRLTKAELDVRVGRALTPCYFPELMSLIADLPVGPFDRLPWHSVDSAPRRSLLGFMLKG